MWSLLRGNEYPLCGTRLDSVSSAFPHGLEVGQKTATAGQAGDLPVGLDISGHEYWAFSLPYNER
jgi:hypothetical protein